MARGFFNGSWSGNFGMRMMSSQMTLPLRVNGGTVTGNSTASYAACAMRSDIIR